MLQKKKMELKEKWSTLSDKEKEPFEKKKRDHLARQGVMNECITDALQKDKGGNSFICESGKGKEIDNKVCYVNINIFPSSIIYLPLRQQGTGAIRAQLRNGCRANQISVCTQKESVQDCLK
jgi:hypothetical protein